MERNYITSALVHPFLILTLLFSSQGTVFSQGNESILKENLQEYMNFIASDATQGRLTGTLGYKKAADYATNIFKEAGLNPGYTNKDGEKSYLQPVPFIRKNYSSTSLIIRKNGRDTSFHHSNGDFVVFNSGMGDKKNQFASPAFIGYGISEAEMGWDDYRGLDLKGKWVIVIDGLPLVDSFPSFSDSLRKKYSDWKTRDSLRYKALLKHKVAGLIILPDKKEIDNWSSKALRSYRYNYIRYAGDSLNREKTPERIIPVMLIGPEIFKTLFSGQGFDPIANKGKYHSYILDHTELSVTINCKKEAINCYNVIATIPGTDSTLKNEYLTVGAHLDHLGEIGTYVCNGANDDASGCVILLEAARTIALNPPKRSVLFILYTGEELSILAGSEHFLRNPPIPIEQISLNINIEQIGSKNRNYKGIWGIGSPQFNNDFSYISSSYQGTNFKYDDLNEEFKNAFRGQVDSWTYIKKGIPAILLSSGGFPEHHKAEDKIELIDFDHLFVASNFLYSFIVELGNEQRIAK